MKKLRDIMRHGFLFTVQRGATVAEAARTMAANNVGIVAVLEGDRLGGGFSGRDIVQKVVDRGLDPARPPVAEGMTGRPAWAPRDRGLPGPARPGALVRRRGRLHRRDLTAPRAPAPPSSAGSAGATGS